MAISVVSTENGEDESQANFANIPVSHSFSLTNASGNNRLVVFMFTARSLQTGDLTVVSAATFNGTAATGSSTKNNTVSGGREISYMAWWDDAALPSTGGSYTVAFTSGGSGASPWGTWAVAELSGVDQSTPLSEAVYYAEDLTAIDTYTPSTGGDIVLGFGTGDDDGGAADPTFTMSDTSIVAHTDSGASEFGAEFAYATDGALSCTPAATYNDAEFMAAAFTAAAAGGLGIPIAAYHHNHNIGSNL